MNGRRAMSIATTSRTIKLLTSFFDVKSATQPVNPYICAKDVFRIRPASQPLKTAAPESVGVPSGYIESFLKEINDNDSINMQNITILRGDKIVCRASFGAQNIDVQKYTFSACKSIVSLAIGMLVDRGILTLEEKVSDIFDKECPARSKVRTKQVTVEDLLTMRSGIIFSELDSLTQENWLMGCLSSGIRGEPGKTFSYNSLNTYLLGEIIRKKTGVSLTGFLEENLFSKLGITDTFWEKDPQGIEKGGWGLYMRQEDMAKLGVLVMNGGVWKDQVISSKEYLDRATSRIAAVPDSYGRYDYGYQMWSGKDIDSFLFNGMLGQNLLGFKNNSIIIVTNGGDDYNFQQCDYFEIVNRYFGGTFFDSLPEDEKAKKSLDSYIKSISAYHNPGERPDAANMAVFLGKKFVPEDDAAASTGLLPNVLQVLENNYACGLESIVVANRHDILEVIYQEKDSYNRLPVGLEKPNICVLTFKNQKFIAAVSGSIKQNEDDEPVLKIRVDFLETPCRREIKIVMKKGGALLKQTETPGIKYVNDGMDTIAKTQATKPIMSMVIGSADMEYVRYKTEKVFCPEIRMKQEIQ